MQDADGAAVLLASVAARAQDERAWRNVQSVLRESFGLLARLLAAQGQQIEALQQQRCKDHDLQHELSELREGLQTLRVSAAQDAQAVEERARLDAKRRVARLRKETDERYEPKQVTGGDTERQCTAALTETEQSFQRRHAELEKRLDRLEQQVLEEKAQQERAQSAQTTQLAEKLSVLRQEMLDKTSALEGKQENRPEDSDASIASGKATHALTKTEKDEMQKELQAVETRLTAQLNSCRREFVVAMNKKLCRSEMTQLLARKMDTLEACKQLAEKADCTRVEEVADALMDSVQRTQETVLNELEQLRQTSDSKADDFELVQLKHNVHHVLSVAESLQQELGALQGGVSDKMSVADVKELLDAHSTMHGLREAMKRVDGEFATKPELDGVACQVQAITRQLRGEIYQARYIWKAGRPSAKQTIPWSSQVVNTNADVFLWQLGSDEVRVLLPGLYYLQAAFFTNYSPIIRVLVNGEPVLVLHSNAEESSLAPARASKSAVHTPSCLQRLRHSAGNVAGLAVDVFLALPAKALVAISYDLDEQAQGFLNLRKL